MLRYKTKARPGLVALYDIRPGNGAGPFLQPQSRTGLLQTVDCFCKDLNFAMVRYLKLAPLNSFQTSGKQSVNSSLKNRTRYMHNHPARSDSFGYSEDNANQWKLLYIIGSKMANCVDDEFDLHESTNQTTYESYSQD